MEKTKDNNECKNCLVLKEALKKALFLKQRVIRKCIEFDPSAGSTYEYCWTKEMQELAKLADVDINKHDCSFYI